MNRHESSGLEIALELLFSALLVGGMIAYRLYSHHKRRRLEHRKQP